MTNRLFLQHAPAASALLLLAGGLTLQGLELHQWSTALQAPPPTAQHSPPPASQPTRNTDSLQNLFGTPPSARIRHAAEQARIQLAGSFVNTDPRASGAILSINGQPPEYFQQGAQVTSRWQLQKVATDHVELQGAGKTLRLDFPQADEPRLLESRPAAGTPSPAMQQLQHHMRRLRAQFQANSRPSDQE